jgi:predicted SAM-dependent methyltransferase
MKLRHFVQLIFWEIVNDGALSIGANRKRRFPSGFRGLNIGCGISNPTNWVGLDGGGFVLVGLLPRWIIRLIYRRTTISKDMDVDAFLQVIKDGTIVHHDTSHGIPFDDSSVPQIYSSHFLEHVTRQQAEALLAECHRVLVREGIIRICVPSLDRDVDKVRDCIREYDEGNAISVQRIVTSDYVGYSSKYSLHRFMYKFSLLKETLESAGFAHVLERSVGEGEIRDVERLDTRTGLFVEAKKP